MTTELMLDCKSNLVMPMHYVELEEEEMSYLEGGTDFWAEVGAGMLDVLGAIGAIGLWLKTAGFWVKIAVGAWSLATKASLAGSWTGAGLIAAIGLIVAGIGLIGPCVVAAYAGLKSAYNHFSNALSCL